MSSFDEDRVEELIRDDIYDHLHQVEPPLFVDWLECDGLDPVGSPLAIPTELTGDQLALHQTAVAALIDFLDSLDVKSIEIERRQEELREHEAWDRYDEYRARHKNGDAA